MYKIVENANVEVKIHENASWKAKSVNPPLDDVKMSKISHV